MSGLGKKMFDDASSEVAESESSLSSSDGSVHVARPAAPATAMHADPQPAVEAVKPATTNGAAEEGEEGDTGAAGGMQFIKTLPTPTESVVKASRAAATPPPEAAPLAPAPAVPVAAVTPTAQVLRDSVPDTPATVSTRPQQREEAAAGGQQPVQLHFDSARKKSVDSNGDRYRIPEDGPVYKGSGRPSAERPVESSSTAQRRGVQPADARSSSDDDDDRAAAVDGTASRPLLRGDSDGEQAADVVELFTVRLAPFVFPRLDGDLADFEEPERERQLPKAKIAHMRAHPPNCTEAMCAHLLATDRRLSIYLATVLAAIVFVIVSIPTSQVDLASNAAVIELDAQPNPDGMYNFTSAAFQKSCYTYWGYKENCDTPVYSVPVSLMWCSPVKTRLQAGAAFSIISLFIYLVLLVTVIITVCCLHESPRIRERNRQKNTKARWVIGGVAIVCCVMQLISWATIAGVKTSSFCTDEPTDPEGNIAVRIVDENKAYGVGFGLNLTAWCLHLLALVQLLVVPGDVINRGAK